MVGEDGLAARLQLLAAVSSQYFNSAWSDPRSILSEIAGARMLSWNRSLALLLGLVSTWQITLSPSYTHIQGTHWHILRCQIVKEKGNGWVRRPTWRWAPLCCLLQDPTPCHQQSQKLNSPPAGSTCSYSSPVCPCDLWSSRKTRSFGPWHWVHREDNRENKPPLLQSKIKTEELAVAKLAGGAVAPLCCLDYFPEGTARPV